MLYDRAFRQRAEATKDLNWPVVNTSLFNLCFEGRAWCRVICQIFLSKQHSANACPKRVFALGQPLLNSAAQVLSGEAFTPPLTTVWPNALYPSVQHALQSPAWGQSQVEIYRLFNAKNGNRCRFPQCCFAHVCIHCRSRGHTASQCNASGTGFGPVLKRPPQS